MRTLLSFSAIAILALSILSCGGTISCKDEPVSLAFNGFDSLSLHKVALVKFKKGSDFKEVIDSVFSGTGYSQYTIDTTGLKINNLTYSVINPDYDYGVYIYSTQRTYKIKEVTFHTKKIHTSCQLCEHDCKNDLSYYLNDSLFQHTGSPGNPPYVNIRR